MGGWGKEAEAHKLRWFVSEKGRGADDAGVGLALPFLRSSLPSPYPAVSFPVLHSKVGTREVHVTARALRGARITPASAISAPPEKNSCGRLPLCPQGRPQTEPTSLASLFYP